MEIVKQETRETSLRNAYYAAEAYYRDKNGLISMELLAPELLAAKTVDKIQKVCERFELQPGKENPCARAVHDLYGRSHYWRFEVTDEFVPSYYSWVFGKAKEISAIQMFYAVCLPIARGESENSDTSDMFELLYHAHKVRSALVAQLNNNHAWIPYQDIRKQRIDCLIHFLPRLLLTDLFEAFQKEEGQKLQEMYGDQHHATSKHETYYFHYWNNTKAEEVVRDALWHYTMLHHAPGDQFILDFVPQDLAKKYLEIMDRYVSENAMSRHRFVFDSLSRTSRLITGDLGKALYLWQLTELQGDSKYKVCKMCGRLFPLGSQSRKDYCFLHSKSNRQYFNKKIKEKEAETAAAKENEREIVV